MPIDPELLAEAQRRGLSATPAAVDPELIAEAKRRGLSSAPSQTPDSGSPNPLVIGPLAQGIDTGLGLMGRGGKALNEMIQKAIGDRAESVGKRFPSEDFPDPQIRTGMAGLGAAQSAMSSYAIPTDKLSAAATIAGAFSPGAGPVSKELAISDSIPFKTPSLIDKLKGGIMTSKAAIPGKYAETIAANPDIMGPGTLDKKTVGGLYDELYKKLGINTTSETYKKLFGSAYPATERETGKLKKMVEGTIDALQADPASVPTEQAIFARQAARKLGESSAAKLDPRVASVAEGHYGVLDDLLSSRGLDSVKKLDQLYFRAAAKEAGSAILPMNKNMTPNALRTNLMALTAGSAAKNLLSGHPGLAAVDAVQAASMSPAALTSALGLKLGAPSARGAKGLASLASYGFKDKEDK